MKIEIFETPLLHRATTMNLMKIKQNLIMRENLLMMRRK